MAAIATADALADDNIYNGEFSMHREHVIFSPCGINAIYAGAAGTFKVLPSNPEAMAKLKRVEFEFSHTFIQVRAVLDLNKIEGFDGTAIVMDVNKYGEGGHCDST